MSCHVSKFLTLDLIPLNQPGQSHGLYMATLPSLNQVLQEQLKHDLNMCAESIQKLQQAVGKYHTSGMACEALNEEEVGTPMLVPVTESLYVPGKVGATDKVLVDIGTGYFVEKTPKGAEEYCKKKVQELRVNMERIMNVVQQKRKQSVMVSEQLSKRGQ